MLETLVNQAVRRLTLPPLEAVFEPTSVCNLGCRACLRWYWKNPSEGKHLTLPAYKDAMSNIGWVPMVGFIGTGGEPLMNPEFNNLIEYNASKHISSVFGCNGTLVTPEIVKFWASHRVKRVTISFDSCDPEEYEAIRIGSNFEKVKNVCKMISSAGLFLQLNMIVFERNVDKVLDYAKFAKEVGASKVFYIRPQYTGAYNDASNTPTITSKRENLFGQTEAYLRANHIAWVNPIRMGTYFRPCLSPFASPWIMLDGTIKPCCFIYGNHPETLDGYTYDVNGEVYTLGNIYKDDFRKIWYGQGLKELRNFIKQTECKEGEEIDPNQLKEWKKYPLSNNRFEQCRACLWRWSAAC